MLASRISTSQPCIVMWVLTISIEYYSKRLEGTSVVGGGPNKKQNKNDSGNMNKLTRMDKALHRR